MSDRLCRVSPKWYSPVTTPGWSDPYWHMTMSANSRVVTALTSRNNLANACRDAGQISEAIPLIEQMLAACERMLGADHPKLWLRETTLLSLIVRRAG